MIFLNEYLYSIQENGSFYSEQKLEAFETLKKMELPNLKEESWRNINLNGIPWNQFQWNSELESQINKDLDSVQNTSLIRELLGLNYNEELNKNYKFHIDFFSVLNLSFLQSLNVISIPKGQKKENIKIYHKIKNGNAFFPFTIIKLEPFSEFIITEEIESNDNLNLWSTTTFIIAEENSNIRYTNIRNLNHSDFFFPRIRILQKRNSNVHISVFHKGGILGKSFIETKLLEENSEFRCVGLFFGELGSYHNAEVSVEHSNNYEKSSILYKAIVKDRSHSVFLGKLETKPGVKGVVSHQINHNLILNKKAKAESRPWLIVRSEDVQCEHGATVGELDEDAIFYLKTRGLTESDAKRLLISGFIYDILLESSLTEIEREHYLDQFLKNL
ncbi:MAG: SufD family Fe-S cluster assembly protein [Leptonema sp. (in: bacteria)]